MITHTSYLSGFPSCSGPRVFRRKHLRLPLHGVKVLYRIGRKVKVEIDGTPRWLEYEFEKRVRYPFHGGYL